MCAFTGRSYSTASANSEGGKAPGAEERVQQPRLSWRTKGSCRLEYIGAASLVTVQETSHQGKLTYKFGATRSHDPMLLLKTSQFGGRLVPCRRRPKFPNGSDMYNQLVDSCRVVVERRGQSS